MLFQILLKKLLGYLKYHRRVVLMKYIEDIGQMFSSIGTKFLDIEREKNTCKILSLLNDVRNALTCPTCKKVLTYLTCHTYSTY